MAAVAGLYLFYRIARLAIRVVRWALGRGAAAPAARRGTVDFYRRFESLMARYGLRRKPEQTQLEFAKLAERKLTASGAADGKLAIEIAKAYYGVRFGAMPPDPRQAAAMAGALARLREFIGGGRR